MKRKKSITDNSKKENEKHKNFFIFQSSHFYESLHFFLFQLCIFRKGNEQSWSSHPLGYEHIEIKFKEENSIWCFSKSSWIFFFACSLCMFRFFWLILKQTWRCIMKSMQWIECTWYTVTSEGTRGGYLKICFLKFFWIY